MDEVTIARLVLGYLREEGCRSAYKDFLKVSRHLQASKFSSKYVPTRFVGLTLNDILKEYFEIYQTVQGRLEATNYYREPHCKTTLPHQLLYLLNDGRQSSRASTPCFRSPGDSHFGETSPVYTDHVSDVEATPAHKLPGNIRYDSEESDVSNVYRNKNRSRSSEDLHDSFATDKDVSTEVVLNTEILAQTLLENKELPEKIAQTINKVAEKKTRISTELDETIQTVVKETAQDPIFDKILEEIIGSVNLMESMKVSDPHSLKNHHSENEVVTSSSKNVPKKMELKEHCEKQVDKTSERVEEQTETIQSLIETTKTSETQPQQAACSAKSDVIVFDGPLDKYILSNSCTIPTPVHQSQTPFVLNANGNLLMVPSTIPTIPTNITSTPANQYYVINKTPIYNCYIPTSTVLTEKDILAMPTVIVSDDRPALSDTSSKGQPKGEIKILPKPHVESSSKECLSEFLTLHKGPNETKSVTKVVTTVSETNSQANKSCDEKESVTKGPSINSKTSEVPPEQVDTNNPLEENNAKNLTEPASTPPQTLNTKKTTPKSGSHVRNLDFSTPPKITSTHKKSLREAKSEKKNTEPKKQAAKMLFKKEKTSDGEKKSVDALPWDAKLRTYVPVEPDKKSPRQRKNTKPKRKKKEDLNTTEQDAALLEAALKTPVKKEKEIAIEIKAEPETREISPKISMNECSVVVMDDGIDKNRILKEMTGEGQKTVLSPSKLNANKRNIVNTVTENKDKFITPETIHDTVAHPVKANRNIIPMLETPVKATLPKTPGIETPSEFNLSSLSNFTPVAKMLEANLPGFDINLPTPNLPITPSFPPFTPTADLLSPYSNRPTDYSTSSSYYQPSDNEQNKSLEAQLLEVEKKQISDETKSDVGTNQHLNIFNKNVIGKKNLNLVKRNETTPLSSASSTSCSSSDTSEDENEAWTERESNDTVICKKKSQETPRKTYALRNRSISGKNLTPKLSVEKESSSTIETQSPLTKQVQPKGGSKTPKKKTTRSEEPQEPSTSSKNNQGHIKEAPVKHIKGRSVVQEAVLKELEEKRLRTINKFKSVENSSGAKVKKSNGKFMKIKPIANLSNHKRKTKKIDSPKKNVPSKNDSSLLNTLRQDLADSEEETEDDISLRLSVSEDDENIQSNIDKKLKKEEKIRSNIDKKLKRVEKTEKSASDVEAQTLIEGLRERGIHLMHNKNTKNPNSKTEQEFPDTESSELNGTKVNNDNSETEVAINDSGPCLNYSLREELDTCLLTEEICFTFSEHDPIKKPQADFDINLQIQKLTAKVYIDEIDKEVDIAYTLTEYNTILDINPSKVEEEISDDKTKDKVECLSGSQSPLSSKKRKYEDDEANDHKEKKCKKILNKINLDNFLTNIHGNK